MGAACSNGNSIVQNTAVSTKSKNLKISTQFNKRKDEVVKDRDGAFFSNNGVERMHEILWQAIENNDQASADKFLDFNDVQESNMYDPFGQTMLHKAAALGHVEILMLLIERTGAKPDIVNAQLATPLHLACKHNQEGVVKFLLGCGVDVNIQDEHGQTPLLICCIHGNKEVQSLLIEASISGQLPEPIEVNLQNHQGLTPLNCASIKGDFEMVKNLVSRGSANVNQSSPKGCTPLIYAGRGGYSEVVQFLIDKKASVLKQDNAGGTVFHHAIEKGHLQVLETMQSLGVDVYGAIEIADNAGRTPLFEAIENINEEDEEKYLQMMKILTSKKSENGFGANPNVVNYSGQTPLFSACRQGSMEALQILIQAGADPDLNNGEMVKPEEDQDNEQCDSLEEQYFLEAFKNCMTPIQVASVLGFDQIAIYLAQQCQADVNIQSRIKKYTALHLCVLANKPEMIIELLTNSLADPMLEDSQGRSLLDMVYQYIPSYVETFQQILESLSVQRLKAVKNKENNITVARHYVNADDERKISVPKTQEEIQRLYAQEMQQNEDEEETNQQTLNLNNIQESDIISDIGLEMDPRVEKVFGRKVALCLVSQNWQYKELAMKVVARTTEKFLTRSEVSSQSIALKDIVDGSLAAVSLTCRDKVIKVFNLSLQLFNMVVQSSRIERDISGTKRMISMLKSEQLIQKFLIHSEQSNTRVTNKIHESLLDLSYQPQLGEDHVAGAVLELIRKNNTGNNQNHKGLLAQLALLYKMINSFKVHAASKEKGSDSDEAQALNKDQILQTVLPSLLHNKDDIRGAASKILIDVQKQTKAVTLADLEILPEKVRESIWEKLSDTLMLIQEKSNTDTQEIVQNQKKLNVVNLEIETPAQSANSGKLTKQTLEKYKAVIQEKGQHKDWTQREIALNQMQECFSLNSNGLLENEEEFLAQCSIILQTSLDDNNIQIYLIAVEVVLSYILKVSESEAVLDALPSLLQSVVLRTTDTNTRVRKRSVEVVNQIWDIQLNKKSSLSVSQIIANVLCDPSLNEKAVIGRLGLLIKKATLIESPSDINKKPLQLILGKDYEQLSQFACQWCLHKNTKVRQCALKLAVEICRLNSIDPRGQPFKQRIINYILGLRSSIRDPLVKKINEVCQKSNEENSPFINETELELSLATKTRASSYDVRKTTKQVAPQALPQIGGSITLPSVAADTSNTGGVRPTIVLPHSEPLSETQLEQAASLIELFGKELITCFYSQTWSSRYVAIQKVEEQLHNLDPNRRDAMSAEINRNNLPPEISFKTLLKFFEDGLKDPVLKNYITILDLIQTVLPLYFRYLRPEQIKRELIPLIQIIVQKTSDLKQKIREASINICLYLSHQSPIGPEAMIGLVLEELDKLSWEKQEVKKDVTNTFGNSNMIVSCLNLLSQFQLQTKLVTESSKFYAPYSTNINKALKHSNPQVRKEGEVLFRTMYSTFQDAYIKELKDQKPQLLTKLISESKAEQADKNNLKNITKSTDAPVTTSVMIKESQQIQQNEQFQSKDHYLNQQSIQALLKGNEDKLNQLKLPNPKKRLIAIVEIKKVVQQKLTQITPQTASQLVEPLSLLLRHLLRDDNVDVYLEALNLLKFIVGNLAPHLSALDLHLMIGQFLTVIVSGQNSNMRARVSSDKVIVYFAKHTNIGSLVVAKEVLKNIERLNKSAFVAKNTNSQGTQSTFIDDSIEEKKSILVRFYGILQMLLQQFSIVLCYQPDFYSKCLDLLSETMSKSTEEPTLKSTCNQLVVSLHQIDSRLLDQGVQSLDFTKKTHIKKIIIELENSSQKGLVAPNQNLVSGTRAVSPDASFRDTQQSFTSINSRTSIMSPGGQQQISMNKRLQRDRNSEVRTSRESNSQMYSTNQSETPNQWRKMQVDQNQTEIGWLERKNNEAKTVQGSINLPNISNQKLDEQGSGTTSRRRQLGQGFVGGSSKAAGFNRNEFNMTGEVTRKGPNDFSIGQTNGIGSSLLSTTKKPYDNIETSGKMNLNQLDAQTDNQTNRPPLYVPTQRTQTKKVEGYQPTILQRLSSQNNTSNSFGTSNLQMGSTSTTNVSGGVSMIPLVAPQLQKQYTQPPPAATFQVKKETVSYQASGQPKQSSFY